MKPTDYTVRLMRRAARKGEADCVVAEMDIEGSERGQEATALHYAKHARIFMRHVRFDYAVAVPR